MQKSRNVLKKVIIIYLVATLIVVFCYLHSNKRNIKNQPITYEFDDTASLDDSKLTIDSAKEMGEVNEEILADENADDAIAADVNDTVDSGKKYYKYTTTNRYNHLRVRKGADESEEIIDRLSPGATGYVLEKGDKWSLIRTPKVDGYSSNSYLMFEEISKEELPDEFPEEYK